MKKLLLIPILTTALIGCGDLKDDAAEVAQEYCDAIKYANFEDAESFATQYSIEGNERWYKENKRKYNKIFGSQRCGIKKVEASEDQTKFTVYYYNSIQNDNSHVEITYFEDKDQLLVTSDLFAVYKDFY